MKDIDSGIIVVFKNVFILFLFLATMTNCIKKESTEVHAKIIQPNRYNVGILIMGGVFNTELTAPYDIFTIPYSETVLSQ